MASLGDYRSCFKTQATSRQEASYGQKRSELGDADANAAGNRKTSSFRNRNSGRSTEVHDGPENRWTEVRPRSLEEPLLVEPITGDGSI